MEKAKVLRVAGEQLCSTPALLSAPGEKLGPTHTGYGSGWPDPCQAESLRPELQSSNQPLGGSRGQLWEA